MKSEQKETTTKNGGGRVEHFNFIDCFIAPDFGIPQCDYSDYNVN